MKYRALTPINFNKVDYAVGDEINVSSSEAAQLLAVNAIEPHEAKVKAVSQMLEQANHE